MLRITTALEIASGNLTAPRTIWIAGRLDASGNPIPYDDDPATTPPAPSVLECFPLAMLQNVSLLWDAANSDTHPDVDPPMPVRPLVQSVFGANLILFSPTAPSPPCWPGSPAYAPDQPVTISGLDLQRGAPAISIPDNPGGEVAVELQAMIVRNSQACVDVSSFANPVFVSMTSCTFWLDPSSTVTVPVSYLVRLRGAAFGYVDATLDGCTFGAMAPIDTDSGLQLQVRDDALVRATVTNGYFQGNVGGLERGVDGATLLNPVAVGNWQQLQLETSISGSTFRDCSNAGAGFFFGQSLTYGVALLTSSIAVSGCVFTGSGGIGGGGERGQVTFDVSPGHRLHLAVNTSQFNASAPGTDGILLYNSTPGAYPGLPGVPGPPSSSVRINFLQNTIRFQERDGIHIVASQMEVGGSIARNALFDNEEDGIENFARYDFGQILAQASSSTVAIVNNMIGFNDGNGIFNHLVANGAAGLPAGATLVAAPTGVTHNTVYGNDLFGLDNQVDPGNPPLPSMPVFRVDNSIFWANGTGPNNDINTINLAEAPNIFWTNFSGAMQVLAPNNNAAQDPQLTNPALRDFTLLSGTSPMRDAASLTPPALPPTDFFGNPRQTNLPGVGLPGAPYADKGAHERTTP